MFRSHFTIIFHFARPIVLFFLPHRRVMRSSLYDRQGLTVSLCTQMFPTMDEICIFFFRSVRTNEIEINLFLYRARSLNWITSASIANTTKTTVLSWKYAVITKIMMIQAFIAHLNENMHSFIYWSFSSSSRRKKENYHLFAR